jgi:hypothetical protein
LLIHRRHESSWIVHFPLNSSPCRTNFSCYSMSHSCRQSFNFHRWVLNVRNSRTTPDSILSGWIETDIQFLIVLCPKQYILKLRKSRIL